MMKRVGLMLAVAAVAGVAVTAAAPAPHDLSIEHFKFLPPTLTVMPGTTVTWVNHDEETHTVTSGTGVFASAGLDHDEKFSHTFTAPGTYTYFCALHPMMRATVVVK
jgi:plastocyanin